jgi:hypothetical protein
MISKVLFLLQAGSTTMFHHFSALAKDISAIAKDYVLKLSKQKIPDRRFIVYDKYFRLPTNVQKSNKKWFLQIFNRFIQIHDILSFSFVRHPFER